MLTLRYRLASGGAASASDAEELEHSPKTQQMIGAIYRPFLALFEPFQADSASSPATSTSFSVDYVRSELAGRLAEERGIGDDQTIMVDAEAGTIRAYDLNAAKRMLTQAVSATVFTLLSGQRTSFSVEHTC